MTLRWQTPPASVCLLRLSAIGDTCHALAVLRALQAAWPQTRFTWIIGKIEARLMSALLPEVEFITFDKRATLAGLRRIRRELGARRFDLLLHLQLALRASAVAALVDARVKLGFDRPRARELQWLFTNARIAARRDEHVLDSFLGFAEALGVRERVLRWDIPLPPDAVAYAQQLIPDEQPTLVISPCSSHSLRNWTIAGYAAIAEHAATRHRMRVILCGGPSPLEREVLSSFPYQPNEAVLHTDTGVMPRRRAAWASWNFHLNGSANGVGRSTLTYDMNRLQSLQTDRRYLVTLNMSDAIDPAKIIRVIDYAHPVYTVEGMAAQERWREISGADRVHFCGAYWRWGFHEDGAWSGLRVSEMLGGRGPGLIHHGNDIGARSLVAAT